MEIPTISKPMRDLIVQVLATVMIPLTIAGTGLYYTRWQQNLNDLKTMIDLVSDQSADRRKYGVAMFEYLLKNDKVPVEFVAAQLDYANSSSDKDLLPLMEGALMKASLENPAVAETFKLALDRLPSRLFVHVLDDKQADCVRKIFGSLKDFDRGTIAVPSIIHASWGGTDHELRVLQESDLQRARDLVNLFNGSGLRVNLVDLSQSWSGAKKVRPNTMELWLGTGPLPSVCTATAGN
jgi:hypothetical protein